MTNFSDTEEGRKLIEKTVEQITGQALVCKCGSGECAYCWTYLYVQISINQSFEAGQKARVTIDFVHEMEEQARADERKKFEKELHDKQLFTDEEVNRARVLEAEHERTKTLDEVGEIIDKKQLSLKGLGEELIVYRIVYQDILSEISALRKSPKGDLRGDDKE